MGVDLSIDPQKETEKITKFIKETVKKANFSKLIVGLSGGVDSAVSLVLALKALREANIFVGLFPFGELNKEGLEDAKLLIQKFAIPDSNVIVIDIKPMVDKIITFDRPMNNLRKGNIIARIRMILLYDLAKKYQTLVLGTENKTEYLLGYFTRFGDAASDVEPIRHLYKTQVRQLATDLKIPEKIIKKVPTAGLWSGQTDEGEFGFSYEEADKIIHLYIDLKKSPEEIVKDGFAKEIVDRVINRLNKNAFKRHCPYTLKTPQ